MFLACVRACVCVPLWRQYYASLRTRRRVKRVKRHHHWMFSIIYMLISRRKDTNAQARQILEYYKATSRWLQKKGNGNTDSHLANSNRTHLIHTLKSADNKLNKKIQLNVKQQLLVERANERTRTRPVHSWCVISVCVTQCGVLAYKTTAGEKTKPPCAAVVK